MPDTCTTTPATTAKCVTAAALFQDRLLEEPPTAGATAESHRRYAALRLAADNLCRVCPLMQSCLFSAVVDHDVIGFVAGTTQRERLAIRQRLSLTVEPEDFDTLAGVVRHHRQVDHDEVLRLRAANPHESLVQLARRLGCSLSTVKRHLRQERAAPGGRQLVTRLRPTPPQVAAAWAQVTRSGWDRREDAA